MERTMRVANYQLFPQEHDDRFHHKGRRRGQWYYSKSAWLAHCRAEALYNAKMAQAIKDAGGLENAPKWCVREIPDPPRVESEAIQALQRKRAAQEAEALLQYGKARNAGESHDEARYCSDAYYAPVRATDSAIIDQRLVEYFAMEQEA